MHTNNKMDIIKMTAEKIIVSAYKNGGKIKYVEIQDTVKCEISDVNKILKQYGTIHTPFIDGQWISYEINELGRQLAESGGFEAVKIDLNRQKTIDILTEKNLELQNNELEYSKKIRKQESIIRWWKVMTAISGLIGIGIGILLFILSQ